MKRELKGGMGPGDGRSRYRFTHHPDEEGTESFAFPLHQRGILDASHTIPMKRELKDRTRTYRFKAPTGFTHHPDEEGTESPERVSAPNASSSFTHHPDEEGTERYRGHWPGPHVCNASHTIPMKRELKGIPAPHSPPIRPASHTIPMKRELKGARRPRSLVG